MIQQNIKKIQQHIFSRQAFDSVYLVILSLYLVRLFFDTTLFVLPWPTWYFDAVRHAIEIYLFVKIIVTDRKDFKVLFFDLIYLILFYFIYKGTGYLFLLELGFFVLAAKDIPYKRILKVYLGISISIMTITLLGALTGAVKDLIYVEDNMFKHAFGIVYTTDFGAHILFLILAYFAVKEREPGFLESGILLVISYLLSKYSGTKTTSIIIVLLVLGGLYIKITNKCKKSKMQTNKIVKLVINIIDSFMISVMPLFAVLSLVLTICYTDSNAVMNRINTIVTLRLGLGNAAVKSYGFSLWGNPFDMIGAGGDVVTRSTYNFIDCSYVMIPIRYGVVLFGLMMIGFCWIAIKERKRGNRYFLVIFVAMALAAVMEHHLLEVTYNIFVLLVFAASTKECNYEKISVRMKDKRKGILQFCLFFGVMMILGIKCNEALAYVRTIVTLLNLNLPERNIYFVLAILIATGITVAAIVMIYYLYHSIWKVKNNKNVIKYVIGVVFCIVLLMVNVQKCNGIISKGIVKYNNSIQENNIVLEQLAKVGGYKLYIEQLPYLYMLGEKNNKKFTQGGFYYSSKEKTVVVTDVRNEKTDLISEGYVCGKISEDSYLYTNDEDIANMLRQNGITMNQYYAEIKEVDLLKLAQNNNLSIDSNNKVLIEGEAKSLIHGPWVTIYYGRVWVEYELDLLDTDVAEDEIAVIRLSSNAGSNILQEQVIKKSNFDENGHYIASIISDIPDLENAEFLLFAKGNTKFRLNSLRYRKVGTE